MCGRNIYKSAVAVAAAVFLSACATPDIDRTVPTFDEEAYSEDLSECRGESVVGFMFAGFTGALAGSAIGAAEGARCCSYGANSAEGALIGSIVGGVIGLGVGAYKAVSEQDEELGWCMREKGYAFKAT